MSLTKLRLRRGTTIDWDAADPVLSLGEPGYDVSLRRIKVGDGVTPWSSLAYQTGDADDLTEVFEAADAVAAQVALASDLYEQTSAAAASVNRELPGGLAGLDSNGKILEQRIPGTFGRRVVPGMDLATEDAAAIAAGVPLLLAPGTHPVVDNLTIASHMMVSSGAVFSVAATKTLTLSGLMAAAPLTQVFTGAGVVRLTKAQTVYADYWGTKGTAAAPTSIIQMALDATAQGSKILLGGKYWTTPIVVDANEDTLTGDLSKSLVGIASLGVRQQTAPTSWGAEIYLGNGQNADVLWLNGTQRGNLQPSRIAFEIDNIKIDGNKAQNATGGSGFRASWVKDVYIGRLLIENCKDRGMYVSAACNQINGRYVETMSCDSHGTDLAALGDSHFDVLLGGSCGGLGVQLGGGTQVNQVHRYLDGSHGLSFTGDNCAVAMARVNDSKLCGINFGANATNNWIGRAYSVNNGTDTTTTTANRSGVRYTSSARNNRIGVLSCPNTLAGSGTPPFVPTQQYDVRFDTSLTGGYNTIGSYEGSNAVQVQPLSFAATVFQSSNRVEIVNGVKGSSVFSVTDYGADPTGTVDSSVAVRLAVNAAAAVKGVAHFPPGTYLVSEEGTTKGCINVPAGAGLSGPGVVKISPTAGAQVRPIVIQSVSWVWIEGITVDLNGLGGTGRHGVYIDGSTDTNLYRVKVTNSGNGGVMLSGATLRTRIVNCDIDVAQNGVTFYGDRTGNPCAIDDATVTGCRIMAGVQAIDSEPVGGYAKNVKITFNPLLKTTTDNYAVTMSGVQTGNPYGQPNENWLVAGNTIVGALWVVHVNSSKILDNDIDATASLTKNAIHAFYDSDGVQLRGNTIKAAPGMDGVALALSTYTPTAPEAALIPPIPTMTGRPTNWKILGNPLILVSGAGRGVRCDNTGYVEIGGNTMRATATAAGSTGIRPNASAADIDYVSIYQNVIDGFITGIDARVASTFVIKRLSIVDNDVENTTGGTATTGIVMTGTASQFLRTQFRGNNVAPAYATPYSVAPIVQTVASTATFTPDIESFEKGKITAQAAGLTIANPAGSALPMRSYILRIKDNGTARSITFGTQYRAVGVVLPTTTVANKTLYLGLIWNSEDAKMDCIAVAQEV